MTSFFFCCWVVALWLVFVLCFGCTSFCFAVVAFIAGVCFFCVAGWLRVVGFAGFLLLLGFVLWRLLFAGRVAVVGVCWLLLCWVCLFFEAFSFGWLLRFPYFYLFSPPTLLLRGSATWAFGLLLPFACSCMFPPSGVLEFSSLLTFGFALPCLLGGSAYL